MSTKEYQRAIADLLRLPALCRNIRAGIEEALDNYALTSVERARACSIARHKGMEISCTLYRASRLVSITRRLPRTVTLLTPHFQEIFDDYLEACPDAKAEFNNEATCFADFVTRWVASQHGEHMIAPALESVLKRELSTFTDL